MIVITGANGMIGRHTAAAADQPFRAWLHTPSEDFEAEFSNATTGAGDLNTIRPEQMTDVDAVIHLASKSVDHDGTGFERTNVAGTAAVLEAAIRSGVRRFVFISSTGVLGHEAHHLADEETPVAPDTPLSESKVAADRLVTEAHRAGRIAATIVRHRFVYGVGDHAVVPRIRAAVKKLPFLVDGGRAEISLIYGPDLGRLLWRFAVEPTPKDAPLIYHATDGQPVRFVDFAQALLAHEGLKPPRLSLPFRPLYAALKLRERLQGLDPETAKGLTSIRLALVAKNQTFSNRRLIERFEDFEFTPLSEGLAASWDWYNASFESSAG